MSKAHKKPTAAAAAKPQPNEDDDDDATLRRWQKQLKPTKCKTYQTPSKTISTTNKHDWQIKYIQRTTRDHNFHHDPRLFKISTVAKTPITSNYLNDDITRVRHWQPASYFCSLYLSGTFNRVTWWWTALKQSDKKELGGHKSCYVPCLVCMGVGVFPVSTDSTTDGELLILLPLPT